MKKRFLIFIIAAISPALAQTPKKVDSTITGLRPANGREARKSNEVTVVLDPPTSENPPSTPAKVTKPEAGPAPIPAPAPELIENLDALSQAETPSTPAPPLAKKQGVVVRVEKLQSATGPVDPAQVKLLTPFPAKPLSAIPVGWKLDSANAAPPFTREIELGPGSKITLSIRPQVLIPDTDGATTFPVYEPGFDTTLGYQQTATVGAILANSVHQIEDQSKQMSDAIDRLQQLLVSLPKPPRTDLQPPATAPALPIAKPFKKP